MDFDKLMHAFADSLDMEPPEPDENGQYTFTFDDLEINCIRGGRDEIILNGPVGPVPEGQWPTAYDETYAAPMRAALTRILEACLGFAVRQGQLRTVP